MCAFHGCLGTTFFLGRPPSPPPLAGTVNQRSGASCVSTRVNQMSGASCEPNTNNKITSTQQFVCFYKAFVNDAPANPVEADMATDHGQSYCTSELTNGVCFVHVTLSGCAQAGLHS